MLIGGFCLFIVLIWGAYQIVKYYKEKKDITEGEADKSVIDQIELYNSLKKRELDAQNELKKVKEGFSDKTGSTNTKSMCVVSKSDSSIM